MKWKHTWKSFTFWVILQWIFSVNALSQLELIKYIQLLAVFQLNSDTFFHERIMSDAQRSCNDVIWFFPCCDELKSRLLVYNFIQLAWVFPGKISLNTTWSDWPLSIQQINCKKRHFVSTVIRVDDETAVRCKKLRINTFRIDSNSNYLAIIFLNRDRNRSTFYKLN